MKKIAPIFLSISLLTSYTNMNGDYPKPWSKLGSRTVRWGCGYLVGTGLASGAILLGNPLAGSRAITEDEGRRAGVLNILAGLGGTYLMYWLKVAPQSGDYLNKTKKFVCKQLISGKLFEKLRKADRKCVESEMKKLEEKMIREEARLQQQIYPKDLSHTQKCCFKCYEELISSAKKHTTGVLNAIEKKESEETLKECLRAFEKEMEEKRL